MRILLLLLLCVFLVACSYLDSGRDENNFYRFQSENGENIFVEFINIKGNEHVDVRIGNGMNMKLKGVRSGSGARYSNGKYVLWNKGDKVMLFLDDKIVFEGKEIKEF